ncbi:MAG: dihydrofolate reductase [Bacteroidetes bacterium]|nr:dihydrofolate reductase [Bacteroidota bacterium]
MISIIVATSKNNVIGHNNQMPWHLPADLKYFKLITNGKPIIMGRNTYESIGRVLPNRKNIIITSRSNYTIPGAVVCPDLESALKEAGNVPEIMIVGGENVYKQILPRVGRIYRTLVNIEAEGDRFFPEIETNLWQRQLSLEHAADEKNQIPMTFEVWEKKPTTI